MADPVLRVALEVTRLSPAGVQVVTPNSDLAFWLPRNGHVTWDPAPKAGETNAATIPHWLAAKRKQLVRLREVASVASDEFRHANAKEADMSTMTNKPEDAGTGVLFRNEKREKPSQPEFKGECIIRGKRYWVAAWVKEKDGKKFFSLAFREAEGEPKPKPKPVAAAIEDDIPFAPEVR